MSAHGTVTRLPFLEKAPAGTRQELALLRAEDAELLAYARATIAAARDGWPDPVAILAGLLEERGQTPPDHMTPSVLLAMAYKDGGDR